jgi:HK97 family phage major capsid protein
MTVEAASVGFSPLELRQRRASVWADMQDITSRAQTEKRTLNQEEVNRWEALDKELEDLSTNVTIAEKQTGHEQRFAAVPTPGAVETTALTVDNEEEPEKRYAQAFDNMLRRGARDLAPEERALVTEKYETRAAGTGSTAGGYLIPAQFRQKLVEVLKWYGPVRDVAEKITTDNGADLPWPTVDDTANVGAILAENTAAAEQDVTFGQAVLSAYMYTSKLVRVSFQLLQDSAFNVEEWLTNALGTRIGRIQNTHFTTGTGTGQPEGIQTNSVVGVTGGAGTGLTISYNDLVSLVHSIDPAYRRRGNNAFMLNDATIAAVRRLRDDSGGAGLGRPLWEPSVQVGQPDSLMAYPVIPNNDMPVMAINAKSILFGDFQAAYVVRDVTEVRTLRLEERYADFLQVGFLLFQRSGGRPQDYNAYKAYKNGAS